MKFDMEKINKWNDKSSDSIWWRPQQGENAIRVIESDDGSDIPSMYVAYKHFNIGPEKRSYWCPKTTGGKDRDWSAPCPVCDYVKSLYDSGNEEDRKLGGSLKASQRILLNVVDLSNADKGVQAFECSKTLWDIMLKFWSSKKWGNLADAKEGYNFLVKREGPKSFPNYDNSTAVDDPSPIADLTWPSNMRDLGKIIQIKSFENLKSIMETGEDIGDTPAPITTTSAKPEVTASKTVTEDKEPPFDVNGPSSPSVTKTEESPAPKKTKKKPPCFGEYDATDDDCLSCPYEELCLGKSATAGGDGMDDLESEIMKEIQN